MRVTFNVPASRATLTAALEGMTEVNFVLMGRQELPALYDAGVRYEKERREIGQPEHWKNCLEVWTDRKGDCEDLAPFRAAELRREGIFARVEVVRTGPKRFHAIVRMPNGTIEDPSKILGMKGRS